MNLNKNLLCNHYRTGTCKFGDSCIFSHDPNNSIPLPDDACLFFLKGNCYHSTSCQYKHVSAQDLINEEHRNNQNKCSSSTKDLSTSTVISNKSFADATSVNLHLERPDEKSKVDLCSFYQEQGVCPYSNCSNVHGEMCELCFRFSMHPFNEQRRIQHTKECTEKIEKDMEESFAYERSKELICGICLEVVVEKENRSESRFGLLTNCDHVFCLSCIRGWRSSNADQRQGCPQCRIKSFFVIPSEYFYDTANNKANVIENYKKALSSKPCKYFKSKGTCPFFGSCFYAHLDENGKPVPLTSQSRITNGDIEMYQDLENLTVFFDLMDFSGDEELSQLIRENFF